MRPLPLVFVLPRDWETVDSFPFCFIFYLFRWFLSGAGRMGSEVLRGEEEAERRRLRPASGPGRFFQQSRIPGLEQDRRVLGFYLPRCLKRSEKNVSAPNAAGGLVEKQRTDQQPPGKPLRNLLSCPQDGSAS